MIVCISSQPRPRPLRSERTRIGIFAAFIVGVRMQAHDAEHLAARFVDGDERHGPRIVDLGEAGDEGVAEVLDRRKEAQPQVLARHAARRTVHRARSSSGRTGRTKIAVPSRNVTCRSHSFG